MFISGALAFCVKKKFLGFKSVVQKRHRSTVGRLDVFGCLI